MTHGSDFTSNFSFLSSPTFGVPPSSGHAKCQLILAPTDHHVAHVLQSSLRSAGWQISEHGVYCAASFEGLSSLQELERLQRDVNSCMHHCLRVAYSGPSGSPEEVIQALVYSRPLHDMAECIEANWLYAVIENNGIFSVFHPIVQADGESAFGYEALMRARVSETSETIGAAQLLYAARKLDLLHLVDRAARSSAIRGAAKAGILNHKLFINFDPSSIFDPEYCLAGTLEIAREAGIPFGNIVFEVTETEKVEDIAHLRKIVKYLREQGLGVALDDVGSGFSTFQFLADIVPDYVKIDRYLVTLASESNSSRHTLESLVHLAQRIGVKVIAEGVETENNLRVCMLAGVDYMQGFLFALPAFPPQQIRSLGRKLQAA